MARQELHPKAPAIAEAVADVAHAAQRIVEERVELLRLEVRNDMRRILKASALGVSGVVALAVAVGLAAASVTWTLALWLPIGAALGITAVAAAVGGVVLSVMARARLPGRSSGQDSLSGDGEDEGLFGPKAPARGLAASERRQIPSAGERKALPEREVRT